MRWKILILSSPRRLDGIVEGPRRFFIVILIPDKRKLLQKHDICKVSNVFPDTLASSPLRPACSSIARSLPYLYAVRPLTSRCCEKWHAPKQELMIKSRPVHLLPVLFSSDPVEKSNTRQFRVVSNYIFVPQFWPSPENNFCLRMEFTLIIIFDYGITSI